MMKKILIFVFAFLQGVLANLTAQLSIDNVQVDSITCNGLNDGKIHVTISGGIPPYVYVLQRLFPNPQTYYQTTASTNVTFSSLEPSNLYQLTVIDDNGNGSPVSYGPYISVKQPAVLTVNITNSSPFCVNSNVQLHGNPSGGNGSYTHTWSGTGAAFLDQTNIENPIFNSNTAGTYNLKYKAVDFKGCADSMEINITVNNLPSVTFGGTLTPQCANSTTYTLSGGSPAGGVYSGPGVSGTNFNASASGGPGTKVITYTYTDSNGCSNSATNTIDVMALPSVSASNNGPVCEGSTLQLFGSGSGTAPISYQWSGPLGFSSTNQNPVVSSSATTAMSGIYTLTVTDGNSCTNQATTNATVIAAPAPPSGLTNQSRCGDGTLSFSASAANSNDSIQWSYDGNTVVFSAKTPSVFTTGVLTAPTTITVYARVKSYSGGCLSNWVSAIGNVYANPTAVASSNSPVCEGGTLTLSALPNGMVSYSWTGPNGYSSSIQNPTVTSSATSAHAGTYTLTVVDGNGCSDTKTTAVTVNPKPTLFNVTGGGSYCAGGSGVLVGLSGSQTGVNYQLKRNGNNTGAPVPGSGSALNFGLQTLAGTYTVEATNTTTGCTATMNGSAVVVVNTPPTPSASNNGPICEGNTLSLSGLPSSGVTYQWTGPNGFSSTAQNPVVSTAATPTMSGSYKLVITDSNGCKDSTTTNAIVYSKPAVTVSSNSPVCGLNTLELYGGPNGMASYSWSGPFGYTSTAQNPTRPNALPSFGGYYRLTVTDSNGCTNTDSTQVTVYAPAIISYNLTDPTVCFYEDAVVTVSGSQSGGYQYTIFRESDNMQVTLPQNGNGTSLQFTIPAASILTVGSNQFYCLVVTPQGCAYTVTNRAIVTKRAEIQKNLTTTNALCFGQNGSITTTPSDGTPPYTMSITGPSGSFGALSQTVTPGSYQVVVKDANNCLSSTTPVTITQPNKINFSIDSASPTCSGTNDGYINFINVTGGTTPYQYSIRGNDPGEYSSNPNFSSLVSDIYYAIVKDVNGCLSDSITVPLNQGGQIFVGHSLAPALVCYGDSGQLTLSASGGSGNYEFSISTTPGVPGPWTTNTIFKLRGGINYYGFARDVVSGCIGYANNGNAISIASAPPVVIVINSIVAATCYNTADGKIFLGNSSGGKGGPYTYYVDGISNGTRNFTNLLPGTHTILVVGAGGCSEDSVVTVPSPPAIVYDSITTVALQCADDMTGEIHIHNPSGGTPPYQYTLNSLPYGTSTDFTGLDGGTYDVKIRDAIGCINSTPVTVDEPAPVSIASAIGDTVCSGGLGTISVVASGGTAPYTYTLTPGPVIQGSGTFTNLPAGTYNVSVTDSRNCTPADTNVSIVTSTGVNIQVTLQHIKCKGDNTGSITLSVSGGVAPYQYSINGDVPAQYQGSPIFTNLAAGTYDIYVKDACGTHHYGNVTLNEPASNITINSVNTIPVSGCKGSATGAIVINASGGSGTLVYSIDGGSNFQSSNIFSNLLAGTYNIAVRDDSMCVATTNATVTEPNLLQIANITTTKVNGPIKGTATINVPPATSGAGNLVYWYDNNPPQISNTFTNLDTGTYMAHVRDQNLCEDSMQFTITDTLALVVNVTTTPVTCYGGTDGRIDTSISGGLPPYTFSITPSVADLTQVPAGNYQITVTDANNSTVIQPVTVTQPAPVGATYTITGYNGTPGTGSIVVNGTGGNGGYQYSFNNGPFGATNTFTDLMPGFYRVITRDGMGCSGPDTTIEIIDDRILELYPSTYTDVTCYGSNTGTATVHIKSGTPPFTIRLRKGSLTLATVVTNLKDYTFTNLSAGTYQFNVRHFYSPPSVNSEVFTINELATSLLTITSVNTVPQTNIVPNGEIHITATGGVGSMASYEFSIDGGTTFIMNAGNFTGLVGDSTYNIAVRDQVGCIVNSTAYVPYGLPLNVQFSKTNETCTGLSDGTIRYKVISGRRPYRYSFNGAPYVSAPDSFTFTMLPPDNYTLSIVDANNDTAYYATTIDPASPVLIDSIVATPSGGSNGTLTVYTSGGSGIFTFTATSYHYGIFTNGPNNVFIGLPADTFIVRVDDICSFAEQTAIVPRDTILLANVSIDPVKCIQPFLQAFINIEPLNAAPGLVTYEAVHAVTNDYYVQFNNGNVEVNDTGTYYIHAFDSQGKHFRDTVTVTAIVTPIVVGIDPIIQPCSTGGQTNIFTNVSGGQAPYSYRWYKLPNFTTVIGVDSNLLNVGEGKYAVVVTDSYGCAVQAIDSVVVSNVQILNIATTNSTCNVGITNGTITVTAIGKGTLQYIWDGGTSTSPVITGVGAGTYTVTVMNESGCSDSRIVTVASNDSLMNLWTYDNQTCLAEGFIQYDVSLGQPNYTFIQVGVDTLVTSSNSYRRTLAPGNYTFKLIDQNGCYDTIQVDILPKPSFDTIVIDSIQVVKSSGANGSITIFATGTYPPLIYKITSASTSTTINNGTNNVFTGLLADTYYVEVTDFSACAFAYDTVEVGLDTILNVAVTIRDSVCNGAVVYLTPLNAYGRVNYQITTDSVDFFINHISDSVFTVSHTGWYRIDVNDQAGKSFKLDTFILVTTPGLFAAVDSAVYPECNSGTTGSIYMRVGGGTPPYTYFWRNALTGDTISIQQLNLTDAPLGYYAFTVNDNAGCSFTHLDSIVVSEVTILTVDTIKSNCSLRNPTGKITITVKGRAPFYFMWINLTDLTIVKEGLVATNSDSIVNVPAGQYMVRVIDANNCISPDTIIRLEAYNPLRGTIALLEMPKCYSISDPTPDGILSVQMQNGDAPYTFNWILNSDSTLIRRVDSVYATADTLTGAFSAIYRIVVRDSNFCFFDTLYSIPAKDSIDFDVDVLNHATCTNLGSVVIRFKGTAPFAYQWLGQPFDTTAVDTIANNSLLAGNYPFTLVDDSGCMVTKPVIIQQSEYFRIDSVIAYEKCNAYGSVALQLSQTAYPAYLKWFDEGDTLVLSSASDNIPLKDGLTAGLYQVRVWNNIGCDTVKTFQVRMDDTLRIDTVIVPESCTGDGSIAIKVLNSSYPFRYQWLNTDTVVTKTNSDTINYSGKHGTYIIAIWTPAHAGCDRLDTLVIPFDNPLIVDAGPDTTICRGKEYMLQGKAYSGRLLGANEALYNWSPVQNLVNNKGNIPNPVIKPFIPNSYNTERVEYVLNVTLDRCHQSDTVVVTYYPSNGVWLPAVDTAARGEYQIIPVIGGTGTYVRYMWAPRTYVLYNSDTTRVLTLNFQGDSLTYYFTGITLDGCYEKASVLIVASPDIKPDDAFTPNGDGINDFWYIPRAEYFPDIHVRVFNRWGDIVYESIGYNNADKVWNGKRKGKDLPIGTYYYVITMSGGKTAKGTVAIIR
ncbi:MAG: gliding motility-associated C-terminal domain-containing protein [Bacteroidales bacterium]